VLPTKINLRYIYLSVLFVCKLSGSQLARGTGVQWTIAQWTLDQWIIIQLPDEKVYTCSLKYCPPPIN